MPALSIGPPSSISMRHIKQTSGEKRRGGKAAVTSTRPRIPGSARHLPRPSRARLKRRGSFIAMPMGSPDYMVRPSTDTSQWSMRERAGNARSGGGQEVRNRFECVYRSTQALLRLRYLPWLLGALIASHDVGAAISIDRVRDEMTGQGDALSHWVKDLPETFFAGTGDAAITAEYGKHHDLGSGAATVHCPPPRRNLLRKRMAG